MTTPPPLEFIRAHIAQVAGIDPAAIEPDARLIDFGLDSAKAMDLVVELESSYGIEIADRDMADLSTIAEVADYVEEKQAE